MEVQVHLVTGEGGIYYERQQHQGGIINCRIAEASLSEVRIDLKEAWIGGIMYRFKGSYVWHPTEESGYQLHCGLYWEAGDICMAHFHRDATSGLYIHYWIAQDCIGSAYRAPDGVCPNRLWP